MEKPITRDSIIANMATLMVAEFNLETLRGEYEFLSRQERRFFNREMDSYAMMIWALRDADRLDAVRLALVMLEQRSTASIGAQPALKTGAVVSETTQVRSLSTPPISIEK